MACLGSSDHEVPKHRRIRIGRVLDHREGLLGDDQHVHRRLWADVVEGKHDIILIRNIRGDLLPDDLIRQEGREEAYEKKRRRLPPTTERALALPKMVSPPAAADCALATSLLI